MRTTSLRRVIVPGVAALSLAFGLAACGSDDSGTSSDGSSSAASGLSGEVAGGGSSAQQQAQEAWRAGFGQANPDVKLSYDPVGSGTGRENFISGAYLYAGTDSALDDDEIKDASETCGADVVEIPVFISPVDVVYNLDGVDDLQLSPETIANIFNGSITTWDDAAIKADNPDADLPSTKIVPVHRSDSSGTTDNFTDYLSQASNGAWADEHSSDWPTTKGESGEGTSGLVDAVKAGQGTIGYADDSGVQGSGLGIAKIKVGDEYVAPSADGAAAALAASEQTSGTPESIITYSLNRTSTDPSTYPIFLTSYEIACPTYDDANTAEIVKGFLTYMVSSDGQKAAAANAYSAPLPQDIADLAQAQIDKIGS
ncbi:phosphate ABC transporter substrate-binding protein PstS [Nocardioides acrostichi]|uniref:Phosphate-binding protein n=1 Tax=Nocardioides acrostichi TaxID=2784339 RepID=A0A930UXA1_9ACTN|nr:phosphate ABC transporter substrate-binding protein PstS [Nocardioides acrostichi]MBF4162568.1 phosphate ABC transporter substrate-binding protein PstS [Nocardioides acrostichi]